MKRRSAAQRVLLAAMRAYQVVLSPIFGGQCRFYPSCSNYTSEAIERWGARRGLRMGMGRVARCHPFAKGGYDPVPEAPMRYSSDEDEERRSGREEREHRGVEATL